MIRNIPGKYMDIKNGQVYYEYIQNPSARETIVCLHGFLASSFSFRRILPYLKNDFHILLVDLPPFGKSGKVRGYTFSYKNLAKTVIMLIEQLNIEKVILLGHSMGGQISLHIAKLRPDLVKSAVLLGSSSYLKKMKPLLVMASYLPISHIFVKRWLERSGLEQNLKLVVYNKAIIDKEMEEGYLAPFLHDDIFRGLAKMIRHWEGDMPREALHQIETPILLIWGEHDKVLPLSFGKRLKNDLKNSKLVVLKDTGHLVPEEQPEEVQKQIKAFLSLEQKEL